MKSKAQVPSIPPSIRQAAAAWRTLHDAGLDEAQEAEFVAWLEADERHAIAFGEISTTWDTFSKLKAVPPAGSVPDPDLLAPARTSSAGRRLGWPAFGLAALAAAALMAIVFTAWPRPKAASTPASAVTQSTQAGERIDLPDGSVVQMNTATSIAVDYTPDERRIRLIRGEAHFVVAKNPRRPFVVLSHNVAVRAVGTAFNVQEMAGAVRVLVTEGTVQVRDSETAKSLLPPPTGPRNASDETLLHAGQQVVVPLSGAAAEALVDVAPADAVKLLGWREHRLEFVDVPLAQVVAEFNRLNQHQLVIADPELGAVRFGGSFAPQAQDAFVRLLEADFGVTAERQGDRTILRRSH